MAGTLLNYVEIELIKNQLMIKSIAHSSGKIKELRVQHGNDYHFYFYDNQILYWPKRDNVEDSLGGKEITIEKERHPNVFSKIIENAIADFFSVLTNQDGSKAYRVYKNLHHHIWEFTSNKNEAQDLLSGLGIYRRISLHPLFLKPKEKIILGFTISASLKYRFLWSVQQFLKNGIDTTPFSVREDGSILPKLQSIYHYLEATGNRNVYDQKIQELEKNEYTFQLLDKIVKWLNTKKAEIYLPCGANIKSFAFRYLPFHQIQISQIFPPTRYFYNNATNEKRIPYYNQQVKEYKPFSYGLFEDKEIKIGVLYPAEYEGRTELFLKILEKSLKEDLHLKKISYVPFKITNSSLEAYKDGMYANNAALKNIDIVIVIVNQDHEKLPANLSPYYVCKAKLIGLGIPTQDVQIETIQNKAHTLVMSNISLNVYAKLGGTAWTIEKEEKLKDELVIGVGSTQSPDGTHTLGIAQIFHPDGRYIVGNCSPLSTFENYAQNLEVYLFNTLREVIDTHINTSSSFRLIFHLYKSAAEEYELLALERLMERFNQYNFDYALLHLGYGHNYRLYADDGKGALKKGSFVQLSPYIGLLHFIPDSTLPLKIEIDKRSKGFNDLFYLTKQIFWFSNLSHRSYNPSKRTVTIMYPSLMAALTEKLSYVDGWNHEMLEYVKEKQWFI